jgi:hypothetical protein
MADYVQVVHARVHPEDEEAMLAKRPAFVGAMKRAVPGLIDANLVKLEDGTWLDIVRWESRESAEEAPAAHGQVAEAQEMDALVAEVMEFKQGYAVEQ